MSDNSEIKKGGMEITKTRESIKNTMFSMLEKRSFDKISIYDLSKEALVSRSTFYVYFKDKYDLLECCMNDLKSDFQVYAEQHTDREIISKINHYVYENSKLLKNLVENNNKEVMALLLDFLSPSLSNVLSMKEKDDNKMSLSHIILMNFCAGGIANLLLLQVNNNFPIDKELMTDYLYKMQKGIEKLDLNE